MDALALLRRHWSNSFWSSWLFDILEHLRTLIPDSDCSCFCSVLYCLHGNQWPPLLDSSQGQQIIDQATNHWATKPKTNLVLNISVQSKHMLLLIKAKFNSAACMCTLLCLLFFFPNQFFACGGKGSIIMLVVERRLWWGHSTTSRFGPTVKFGRKLRIGGGGEQEMQKHETISDFTWKMLNSFLCGGNRFAAIFASV